MSNYEMLRLQDDVRGLRSDIDNLVRRSEAILNKLASPSGGPEQAERIASWQAGADEYENIDWRLVLEILRKS